MSGAPAPEPLLRILDNPLLIAQARRRLRRQQIIPGLGIVVLFSLLVVGMEGTNQVEHEGRVATLLVAIIAWLLYARGTVQIGGAISTERDSGLLDFHRATPTTPLTDAVGYLLGMPAREYVYSLVVLPFLVLGMIGAPSSLLALPACVLSLLLCALLFHSLALVLGLANVGKMSVRGSTVMVLIALGALTSRIGDGLAVLIYLTPWPFVSALSSGESPAPVDVYGVTLPPLLYHALLLAPATCFFVAGAARKLRDLEASVFSRRGALAFFGIYMLLLLGSVWTSLGVSAVEEAVAPLSGLIHIQSDVIQLGLAVGMLSAMAVVGAALMFSVAPGPGAWLRSHRRALRAGHTRPPLWDDGASSWPVAVGLAMLGGLGLALFTVGAGQLSGPSWLSALTPGVCALLSLFLLVGGTTEYSRLALGKSWRSGVVLVAFLSFALPWLAAILGAASGGGPGSMAIGHLSPITGLTLAAGELSLLWPSGSDTVEVDALAGASWAWSVSLTFAAGVGLYVAAWLRGSARVK